MPSFLIESYVSADQAAAARQVARARAAAESQSGVSYVRSTHIPGDETCQHVFHAPSLQALADALRRADLTHLRIVEAVEAPVAAPGAAER